MAANRMATQSERILQYLRDFGEISARDAIDDLGVYRLGARVYDLRAKGHPIKRRMETAKNRYGVRTSYVVYYMEQGDKHVSVESKNA